MPVRVIHLDVSEIAANEWRVSDDCICSGVGVIEQFSPLIGRYCT